MLLELRCIFLLQCSGGCVCSPAGCRRGRRSKATGAQWHHVMPFTFPGDVAARPLVRRFCSPRRVACVPPSSFLRRSPLFSPLSSLPILPSRRFPISKHLQTLSVLSSTCTSRPRITRPCTSSAGVLYLFHAWERGMVLCLVTHTLFIIIGVKYSLP